MKKIRITRADIKGPFATPADRRATWDLDMDMFWKQLMDGVDKTAFQRRVRYLKAMKAQEGKGEGQA